jgi:putative chitinase
LPDYGIDTPQRVASFLAQCAHESGGFVFLKENLQLSCRKSTQDISQVFPNDALAEQYASQPNKAEAIANRIYANRMGNGPEESGDGLSLLRPWTHTAHWQNNYSNFADSA